MSHQSSSRYDDVGPADRAPDVAAGKRTRTMDLRATLAASVQMMCTSAPRPAPDALQLQGWMDAAVRPDLHDGPDLHAAAAHATSGAAGALPFADTIAAAFGRHDVSRIQAHTDGAAHDGTRAMGAQAFAMGDHVAFGGAPDLHTAAHEAAHVVQQRGGVHLKGGVGEEGDRYEQHADAVADLVVAGRSAEALLDRHAGPAAPAMAGAAPATAMQCKWLQHGKGPLLRWDTLVNGLRWYLDQESGRAFFQIELDPGVPEEQLRKVERLEGPSHQRTIEQWCETPLFEPSTSSESTAIEPSTRDLGPTTVRGVPIPRVGFGTDIGLTSQEKQKIPAQEQEAYRRDKAYNALTGAVATGSTMFDTAFSYGTLDILGRVLKEQHAEPQDLFIVYKIKPSDVAGHFDGDLVKAVTWAIETLGVSWLDVLMLHELPRSAKEEIALADQMQRLVAKGLVRYLGLSNVTNVEQLHLKTSDGQLGVSFVQNKMHPHRHDKGMRGACRERGITYMGYSIMGSQSDSGTCGQVQSDELDYDTTMDPALGELAKQEGLTGGAAQLAVSWAVNEGTVQIPKSTQPHRMVDNRRAGTHALKRETMEQISGMDDTVTDEEELLKLSMSDAPGANLKLILRSRSCWRRFDQLGKTVLGKALVPLDREIAGRTDARAALLELLKYIQWIDDGLCTAESFVLTDMVVAPGDYRMIVEGLLRAGPLTGLLGWWTWAQKAGGCVRACTRIMHKLAHGEPPEKGEVDDEDAPTTKPPSSDPPPSSSHPTSSSSPKVLRRIVVPISDVQCFPEITKAKPNEEVQGMYAGKMIEFTVVSHDATHATIDITRED